MYKIIINLKTYKETTGRRAVEIANACMELDGLAKSKNVDLIVCPQAIDMKDVLHTGVKVYAQHIDAKPAGKTTGYAIAEHYASLGVSGTLISHSEHILELNQISETLKFAHGANFETCICARDNESAAEVAKLSPNFVAVEPPELIGSSEASISNARPDLIEKSVSAVGDVPLLIGAGVKNSADVSVGVKLGAKGVLLASQVAKAEDPKAVIEELLNGF